MPPKKRTSSKKKKNKETEEDRKVYASAGRKDAKGMARALPKTAQGLKSGEVSPDEVASRLEMLDLKGRLAEGQIVPVFRDLLKQLSRMVIPVTVSENVRETLVSEFFEELQDNWRQNASDGNTEFSSGLQKAFDETCAKVEFVICSCYTGRPLRETCPLYKTTPEAFTTAVNKILGGRCDTSQLTGPELHKAMFQYDFQVATYSSQLKRAADGIREGDDVIGVTCWECKKHEPTGVLKCSRCKAARYCSRECHVKSWRGGHKNACMDLMKMHQHFEDNQERVTKAIDEGVCGIQPNPKFDFRLVRLLMVEGGNDQISSVLGLPSMEVFYQALTLIINGGEHWIFPDTLDASFESGSFNTEPAMYAGNELFCFQDIAVALCYNASKTSADVLLPLKKELFGSGYPMTAQRFVQIYSSMSAQMPNPERCLKEARSDSYVGWLKIMMAKYHKKN